MDDNNTNNSNASGQSPSGSPILSKRGQFDPNLTQNKNQNIDNPSNQIPLYQEEQQPLNQQSTPYYGQNGFPPPQGQQNQSAPYGYQNPYTQQQLPANKLKHSGLGITSFVISLAAILSGILCFVLVIFGMLDLAGVNIADLEAIADEEAITSFLINDPSNSSILLIGLGGLLLFVSLGLALIGGILGIIGVVQKNRKKVFSILGLIFNAVICLGFVFILLLGLAGI